MAELPPWRSPLAKALHRNRSLPHLRFVQLATVAPSGRPHNRTIVYRGLREETSQLKFVTDARSEKINHLAHQPWVEVCWYFTKTREQFRFAGELLVLDHTTSDEEIRNEAWNRLSDNAKTQFFWPEPGHSRAKDDSFSDISPTDEAPESFIALLLTPNKVDHLELRGAPQNRTRYQHHPDESWSVEAINP